MSDAELSPSPPPASPLKGSSTTNTAAATAAAAAADGDWTCEECANVNFAWRGACNRCAKARTPPLPRCSSNNSSSKKKLGQEIGKQAAEKSRGLFSADDWQCNKCGNVNWARRQQCNVCNAPKFGDVEERTGFGGGYNDRGVVEYKERADSSDDEYDEFGRRRRRSGGGGAASNNDNQCKPLVEELQRPKAVKRPPAVDEDDEEEEEEEEDDDDGDLSKYDLSDWGDCTPAKGGDDAHNAHENSRSKLGSRAKTRTKCRSRSRSRSRSPITKAKYKMG